MPRQRKRQYQGTGIARHTSTVALTAARAVTSHARTHYHKRYRGRYRNAWLVFLFDMVLLGIALALLIVNLLLFGNPFAKPIGLTLSMTHADVVAETMTPIEVTIRSTDGLAHDDVRLNWRLPAWVEVVRADPPLVKGVVQLGRIAPGQTSTSRLYLRARATPGTQLLLGFELRQGSFFTERSTEGADMLVVASSALTVEPVMPVEGVIPGGTIPLEVSNKGTLPAPAVIVRLTSKDGAPESHFDQGNETVLGSIAPGERRLVLLEVDPAAHGRLDFSWEVQDASRAVSVYAFNAESVDQIGVDVTSPLTSIPEAASTDISYESSSTARLLVFHPLQATTTDALLRSYDLAPGTGIVHIPLRRDRTTDARWWVLPYLDHDGRAVFGKRLTGTLSTAFPVSLVARYYSPSGDQIGVGPLPPVIGVATTYWVVWSVGPTDADLKDIDLRATLGATVRATGKFASIIPGEFSSDGNQVHWTVPSLPATGASPATFAFEVSFTPSVNQRGTIPSLVTGSAARAVEIRSGLDLQSSGSVEDTNLSHDEQAKGKGTVQ
ncbi:MAG: hypothetical protein ABIO72_04835 [Patescibacteria group bacterium]